MTDHANKPRGADRRGFFQFAWINERRSGVDRRAVMRYERRTPVPRRQVIERRLKG